MHRCSFYSDRPVRRCFTAWGLWLASQEGGGSSFILVCPKQQLEMVTRSILCSRHGLFCIFVVEHISCCILCLCLFTHSESNCTSNNYDKRMLFCKQVNMNRLEWRLQHVYAHTCINCIYTYTCIRYSHLFKNIMNMFTVSNLRPMKDVNPKLTRFISSSNLVPYMAHIFNYNYS